MNRFVILVNTCELSMFRITIFVLSIFVLGAIADDEHGKDVVNLVKDSFDTEVGKKPTLVMFFAPW